MSKLTKSKWTVPLYTRRDGKNRCWVMQGKTSICRTFGKPKIAETNAHLIASAPTLKKQRDDLLTACKKAKTALNLCARVFLGTGKTPEPDVMADAIIEIEAAIANCEK